MRFPLKSCRGFTLLEILVVMAVIVLIAGTAIVRIGKMYRVESRQTASRLISVVRYIYNKAATENLTIRLVFDFENSSYWAESTSEKFLIERGGGAKEDSEEASESSDDLESGDGKPLKPKSPGFGAIDEPVLQIQQIPSSVYLKDVYTSHDDGPVSFGKAYIYFFPNGTVEPAVINFRDKDDKRNFSLKINPVTGNADYLDAYRTLE